MALRQRIAFNHRHAVGRGESAVVSPVLCFIPFLVIARTRFAL